MRRRMKRTEEQAAGKDNNLAHCQEGCKAFSLNTLWANYLALNFLGMEVGPGPGRTSCHWHIWPASSFAGCNLIYRFYCVSSKLQWTTIDIKCNLTKLPTNHSSFAPHFFDRAAFNRRKLNQIATWRNAYAAWSAGHRQAQWPRTHTHICIHTHTHTLARWLISINTREVN